MSKGIKYTLLVLLFAFLVVSVYLFVFYLPGVFKYSDDSNELLGENDTYKREKHVMLISGNLSDSFEHQSFMSLKSLFSSYDNILISILDSEGSVSKQQDHITSAFNAKADVVVINPLNINSILPDIEMLYNNGISVIALGNHPVSPYYISMGYTSNITGKLLAQNALGSSSDYDVSAISCSPIDRNSSNILSGFIAELKNLTDDNINYILYTYDMTDKEINLKLEKMLNSKCIVIQDARNFQKLYDMIIAKGYSGKVMGIIQSYDNLTYIINNKNVVFVLQDPDLFNKQLFNTLLDVFKNPMENQHIEVSQIIVNSSNISEYIKK